MATRTILFMLALLIVGQSCRPPGEEFAIKTDPEFLISVREALGPAPRSLEVAIVTRDSLPCKQSNLIYAYHKSDRVLDLMIEGFHFPEPCVPALRPNMTAINTAWFDPTTYHLKLGIGEFIRNSAVLTADDESLNLYLSGKDGFEVRQSEVLRLPNQAIWGRIDLLDSTGLMSANAILEAFIFTQEALMAGHYGHFEVRAHGEVIVPGAAENSKPWHTLSFACEHALGADVAEALQGLLTAYEGRLNVQFWTAQHRVI